MTTNVWPPVLLDLPESCWTLTDGVPRTRIRVNGYTLELFGLAVATDEDGVQQAADTHRESLLLGVYDPEEPWQVWRGFGADYALVGVPATDQDGPVSAEVTLDRPVWSGSLPEFEEEDRKLVTAVIRGHCSLHLEARRVTGTGQEFAVFPDEREPLAELAGWAGPYPTLRIDNADFVLFAYPHGD